MNMISQLRQRVKIDEKLNPEGIATITAAEYDQLQAEWILRTVTPEVDDIVDALERLTRRDQQINSKFALWGPEDAATAIASEYKLAKQVLDNYNRLFS